MSRVDVSIVHTTTAVTYPLPHAQLTQSARPALGETGRASQTGPRFIDIAILDTKPHGFIRKHRAKLRPSCVVDGFGHTRFGQFVTRYSAHSDQSCTLRNGGRGFVCPILPTVDDLGKEG